MSDKIYFNLYLIIPADLVSVYANFILKMAQTMTKFCILRFSGMRRPLG